MFGKTPVSALEEYCAKKSHQKPVYDFYDTDENKVFTCLVHAINEMAEGTGRSKKEAKHDAATHLLKKLKFTNPDIQEIPQASHDHIPVSDAVADLRDLCLQLNHPFPTFEIVQQDGPPEAPEFVVECRVATIRRFGTASTKKGAKQLAAKKIVDIIRQMPVENDETELVSFNEASENQMAASRKKIQTYREYIESENKKPPGVLLSERHKFFKNLDKGIKEKALAVINSDEYLSAKEKFNDLVKELGFTYRVSNYECKMDNYLFVEILCGIDACFIGKSSLIYDDIIERMKVML